MNFAMATLGLKEIGKFIWEGREKGLPMWLSQFSFAKGSHSKIHWENAKKSGIMKSGLDTMPLFLLDDLLSPSNGPNQQIKPLPTK